MSTGTVSLAPHALTLGRYVDCVVKGGGDVLAMLAIAEGQGPSWANTPSVKLHVKAAVDALDSTDFTLGPMAHVVSELLRPITIIGKVTGFQKVPFRMRLYRQTGGMTAGWVREGYPIPASKADYSQAFTLEPAKLGVIVAMSDELKRFATPSVQELVGREVSGAIGAAKDSFFIDPSWSGAADTPASVTFGAAMLSSRGATVAAIDADLKDMLKVLTDAGCSLASAAWILHPTTAANMSLMRDADGALSFPTMAMRNGTLAGLPVVTSPACSAAGSPGERFIVLLEANEVLLGDDGASEISVATHAAIQLNDDPSHGPQPLTSLWSQNLLGIRARLYCNWLRRHDGAVVTLRDLTY